MKMKITNVTIGILFSGFILASSAFGKTEITCKGIDDPMLDISIRFLNTSSYDSTITIQHSDFYQEINKTLNVHYIYTRAGTGFDYFVNLNNSDTITLTDMALNTRYFYGEYVVDNHNLSLKCEYNYGKAYIPFIPSQCFSHLQLCGSKCISKRATCDE